VTTNLADSEPGTNAATPSKVDYKLSLVERIGTRARSRLFEMCRLVRMPTVGDYRQRKL
jgi:DNA replication protein DnaC